MKKTIAVIIALVVVLVLIVYGFEFIFKKPVINSPTVTDVEEQVLADFDIKEQYQNGSYTFVGNVAVPTPCHTLEAMVQPTSPDQYWIVVTTVPPKEGVVCAQVIADKSFKVNFEAPADVNVGIIIDGTEYELNRFVVPEGENIDTYELMIKA